MRIVRYPRVGRPLAKDAENLEELVMLAQAAISIANTQRRVLDRVLSGIQVDKASALPTDLKRSRRDHSYEVTVVDHFFQLGQQSFAHHGSVPMWERPMHEAKATRTDKRGRPVSVDISLFNLGRNEESRIEFGFYTKVKLKSDAVKLANLDKFRQTDYQNISNYLILWDDRRSALTVQSVKDWLSECERRAGEVSSANFTVRLRMVSSVDLFSEDTGNPRVADVALFEVEVLDPKP